MEEKTKCKHHDICSLHAEVEDPQVLCILHSKDPNKDAEAFDKALKQHLKIEMDEGVSKITAKSFSHFVFPKHIPFDGATFSKEASFFGATFYEGADFKEAEFSDEADFAGTKFNGKANFFDTTFSKEAHFENTHFFGEADFRYAQFLEKAYFCPTMFQNRVSFRYSSFSGGVIFSGGSFKIGKKEQNIQIFSYLEKTTELEQTTEVDFRKVNIGSSDAPIIRNADLRKCEFLFTNMQSTELTDVQWPEISLWFFMNRIGVYDEDALMKQDKERLLAHIERLYRELKQNFTNRGDHATAGDFHYGEKEMCRKNPKTPTIHRIFLWLYWFFSGYGERYLRPLLCGFILLAVCTTAYLLLGISPQATSTEQRGRVYILNSKDLKTDSKAFADALENYHTKKKEIVVLSIKDPVHWLRVYHYSIEVMFLRKPTDLAPISLAGKFVLTMQSFLGPLILALFALAVRQRLRR